MLIELDAEHSNTQDGWIFCPYELAACGHTKALAR